MAKKTNIKEVEHRKWERIYEDEDSISIWRFDSKKSLINPCEVEIKYKTEKKVSSKRKSDDK
jgi:hypothetical protein